MDSRYNGNGNGSGANTLRRSLLGLYLQRRLIVRVFLATMLVVIVVTLLMRPIFRAESSLLVTVNRAKVVLSPDTGSKPWGPVQISEEDLNSVVSMLRGRDIVKEALQRSAPVAGDVSLDRRDGLIRSVLSLPWRILRGAYYTLHGRPFPTSLDRQVDAVAREIEILPVRKSNVIQVAVQDADPAWASAFVNRLVDVFLEHYAKTSNPSEAEAFFDEQSRMLSTKLREADDSLRAFREQVGIVAIEEQRRSAVEALTMAQREIEKLAVDEASSQALLSGLSEGLKKENPLVLTARRQSQAAAEQAKVQLLGLEARRVDLLTKYAADSERVRELDAQVAVARALLEREIQDPLVEQDFGVNRTHETLAVERAMERSRSGAIAARRKVLEEQVLDLQRRMQELDANSTELARMESERKLMQESYVGYVQQMETARLSNALNQSQILNLAIASPATPPVTPVRPRVTLNLLLGMLLGASLGVAAALVSDSLDRSVQSADDVKRGGDVDVLAVIPQGG